MSKTLWHKRLKPFIKPIQYLLAIIPIAYILGRMDFGDISNAIDQIAPWAIPFIIVSSAFALFLQGFKWWYLMRSLVPNLKFSSTIRYHFIGCFYSVALPTSAAQDVLRAIMVGRISDNSSAWAATWIHKIGGLLAVVGISFATFTFFLRSAIPIEFSRIIPVSVVVLIMLLVLSFSKRVTKPVRMGLEKVLPSRVLEPLKNGRQAIYLFRNKPLTLLGSLLLSFCIQFTLILGSAVSAYALTGKFFPFQFMAFIPLIELTLMVIPLTPNGLGIREGLTALFFERLGFTAEETGIYIAFSLLAILVKLAGGIALFWKPEDGESQKTRRKV